MTIPEIPALSRTSPTFRADLDALFLTQIPATIPAFNAEMERVNQFAFGAYTASSTSELTVSTGTKALTIEPGKSFIISQPIIIADKDNSSRFLYGRCNSHNSTTGDMSAIITQVSGSGSGVNWAVSVAAVQAPAQPAIVQRNITSSDTLLPSDLGKLINTSGTFTVTLTAAATLGDGWWCYLRNTSNGDVTIDPSGTETVDGSNTLVIKPGNSLVLMCSGTAFTTLWIRTRTYFNRALFTSSSTFTVPPDTYVMRGYAMGAGDKPAAINLGGGGGGMAFGDFSTTPGEVITLSISARTATITRSGVDVLIGYPATGSTGGTASKHSSVTNGGANSGGTVTAGMAGASSGSPLGGGFGPNASGTGGGSGWGGRGINPSGGGVGGPATADGSGPGLPQAAPISEPLLQGLTAPSASSGGSGTSTAPHGGPGAGGSGKGSSSKGGDGGFGGGGGFGGVTKGGFGGGAAGADGLAPAVAGLGGGGSGSSELAYRGDGGAAAIYLIY